MGNVEKNIVMRTDEVAEERDLVGVYLHEISRTPLLDAAEEVDLSKASRPACTRSTCSARTSFPTASTAEELEAAGRRR